MLAEAARVIAPGGALFVYTHVRKNAPIAVAKAVASPGRPWVGLSGRGECTCTRRRSSRPSTAPNHAPASSGAATPSSPRPCTVTGTARPVGLLDVERLEARGGQPQGGGQARVGRRWCRR